MRIALAQVNPVVGDVAANTALAVTSVQRARQAGADLVVLPEMVMTGYPPKDLLEHATLVDRCHDAVTDLARSTRDGPAVLVGYPARNPRSRSKPLLNVVALLAGGRLAARYVKRLLPSYDVFDEERWFEAGEEPGIVEVAGRRIGLLVCEDIWNHSSHAPSPRYEVDPLEELASRGVDLIVNPSASPFEMGKPGLRVGMLEEVARSTATPLLFVNQVGGNDELVFDGGSLAVDRDGTTRARGPLFEQALVTVTLREDGTLEGDLAPWPASREETLHGALVTGLGDYVRKCGFEDVLLGLSGGIDSAVVACLAASALGREHVTALAMPSRFSSEGSIADARALAGNLGIELVEVPIEPVFVSLLETLAPHLGDSGFGLAEENLQARVRGTLLMAFSNRRGALVLATGNKSELACGYCTLYGDMVGALAPIGDVLKTDVYALARHINKGGEVIPRAIIEKPPSAELRPDQTDQDTLPPYDVLDRILRHAIEEGTFAGPDVDASTVTAVLAMVRRAEHKRAQAPVVIKVSPRAFGPGRRYPIAQGFEE